MTIRPGPLRAAAVLAVAFVAVRVVYRVLFHGADGTGAVVLPLPELRLPPPFSHVVVLGPVTVDGLWDAAASAFPIALTILAFGLVNSLVDVPRVLARASRRGPLRGIARALAIAWATLPSLADAARRVRFAQRLRGERAGVRMLMPLLQRTLERAGSVAAALELRGFAGRSREGDCRTPVEVHDAELGFGAGDMTDAGGRSIRIGSLVLAPGSLTLLTGATGSGKSTLLRALAGLHTHVDGGWMTGTMRAAGHDRQAVPPRDLAQRIGVVLQNPREAFATERVRDELGLALELRGVAPVLVAARVAEVARRVGIAPLLDRPTRGLSAGEATLVAVAAAITEQPLLLLVDEPLADLDADTRTRVAHLLRDLAHEAGMCVLVAEHRADPLRALADTELRIAGGAVADAGFGVGTPADRASDLDAIRPLVSSPSLPGGQGRDGHSAMSGAIALRATDVTVRHGSVLAIDRANIELQAGEIVALVGANGAGKSSLLAALALPGRDTRIESEGRVALVPDASDDLFVYDTVAAECRRADRRAGASGESSVRTASTAERVAGFLGLDPDSAEFTQRLARHPRDLSVGERRCLALAIQLAGGPAALLVDEPTRGLDPEARGLVWAALATLSAQGTAVLVASHEPDVAAGADRVLSMRDGVLSSAGPFAIQSSRRLEPRVRRDPAVVATPRTELRTPTGSASHRLPDLDVPTEDRARASGRAASRRAIPLLALVAANLVALGAFCWPLLATAVPAQAHAAVPVAALALAPLAALVVFATLDGSVRSAHMLALLGTLAAIGAAVRIASTGVGGVEAVFILLILAGRAFGARFGMLLGMATIALSTVVTGTFGPWTPFQMFACAWVGAVAGLLPRRLGAATEIAMLCVYGAVASYMFGLLMNLWFWPFAVGFGTEISYDAAAPLGTNVANFLLYSLVTSTLSWDTLRAITSLIGILIIGRPVLAALRRAKPLQPRTLGPAPTRGRTQENAASAGGLRG
ncbi:ATP-binding cassette domain-containing protein [Microbacterium yannicii]|uniref:ATP-binding cassette domain-containing protein n=1 Tax=Microbacterium yannicii TaxID=671622 RepID=UPI00031147B1|nr:ATP-binding cassette domain-containing protein [Microbacterium yannicii]